VLVEGGLISIGCDQRPRTCPARDCGHHQRHCFLVSTPLLLLGLAQRPDASTVDKLGESPRPAAHGQHNAS